MMFCFSHGDLDSKRKIPCNCGQISFPCAVWIHVLHPSLGHELGHDWMGVIASRTDEVLTTTWSLVHLVTTNPPRHNTCFARDWDVYLLNTIPTRAWTILVNTTFPLPTLSQVVDYLA